MALAILDGTQTATTLSSVVTGGEHIVAHSVVSLGSNAISNIATAVSGSTVCVGNLGLLQSTVATEGLPASGSFIKIGGHTGTSTTGNIVHVSAVGALRVDGSVYTQPISGTVTVGTLPSLASNTDFVVVGEYLAEGMNNYGVIGVQVSNSSVTVGNSLTIGSLPAISGTVTVGNTVNFLSGSDSDANLVENIANALVANTILGITNALPAGTNRIGVVTIGGGTVTIGAGTAIIGNIDGVNTVLAVQDGNGDVFGFDRNFPVDIMSALPAGTNRIGVVTIGGGTVTIGAGTSQIGSVTASLAISSTAITSGSFSSLTSATLVPGNTARKMATVYNLGAGQLFVNAGASATTLGGGFMVALSSGDYFECDYTTTTLSAIFATAGTASWVSH